MFKLPFLASVKPISTGEIATKPVVLPNEKVPMVTFIDADSFLQRNKPKIPAGSYGHRGGVDIVKLPPEHEDLWLYHRATAKQCMLPASEHGLELDIDVTAADNRLLVCGALGDYDSGDVWKARTQLWSLPELQRISDYQSTGDLLYAVLPVVFGELFAFPLDAARWQVANLRDGKARFVVGHEFPGDNPVDDGLKTIAYGGAYSAETGVILTVEETSERPVTLNAYDASTGKKMRTVELEGPTPASHVIVHITKVSGQWVLFEESVDPSGELFLSTKHYFAYRIEDFKKMNKPISIRWNGTRKPIIDKGRLVIPWKDHLLLGDLSTIVAFEEGD